MQRDQAVGSVPEVSYHEKVRTWAVERLCDKTHTHHDSDYAWLRIEEITFALAECFDMDDERLPEWDFEYDYREARQWSEVTFEEGHADLLIKIPLKCQAHVLSIHLADGDELERGQFSFAQILRELIG